MKKVLVLGVFACAALLGVYFVITIYDNNMKIGRLYQTPVVRPHEEPQLLMDERSVPLEQSELIIKETLKQPVSVMPTPTFTQSMIVKGEKEYKAFCSHCHGDNLDGQGTVGQSFHPLPTNLLNPDAVKMTDEQMFAIISYGREKTPGLASSMTVDSRLSVIKYVRHRQHTAK